MNDNMSINLPKKRDRDSEINAGLYSNMVVVLSGYCDKCMYVISHFHRRSRYSAVKQYVDLLCNNGNMWCKYCDWTSKCNCSI